MRLRSPAARIVHALATLTAVVLCGVLLCYVLPCVLLMRADALTEADGWRAQLNWLIPCGWLILLGLGVGAVWKRISWWCLSTVLLLGTTAALYFWWDSGRMAALPDLGPARDAEDPGWRTVGWLLRDHPQSRLEEIGRSEALLETVRLPVQRDEWRDYVEANRAAIEQAWEADTVGREWVSALCAHPPTGIHALRYEEPILAFMPIRNSYSVRAAHAYGLALAGHRDEAAELVLAEGIAMQHLSRCEASLVHQMIAVVVQRETIKLLGAILDLGPVSEASVGRIRDYLSSVSTIGTVFRLGFLGDYHYSRSVDCGGRALRSENEKLLFATLGLDEPLLLLQCRIFGIRLLVLPATWSRDYLEFLELVCQLASDHELGQLDQLAKSAERRWTIRNAAGTHMIGGSAPDFAKIARNVWMAEDARVQLLLRIENQLDD